MAAVSEPTLEINGVEKSFGAKQVLRGVKLRLSAGRITALLAKNGAGKSTLVSLIAGRLLPDGGEIRFMHQTLTTPASNRRQRALIGRIGVAPQDTGVYPDSTAMDNLIFAGGCYGLRGKRLRESAAKALERLGLEKVAKTRARHLSGGQKRRLHTAMALVHEPDLILLDEPTVGSDPEARRYILDAVRDLASEGATLLYTSHYFPEIEALRADIAIMNGGRISVHGTYDEIAAGARNGEDLEEIFFAAHAQDTQAAELTAGAAS